MKIKAVIGLGNPGDKYRSTRHNVGFMALDWFSAGQRIDSWKARLDGHIAEAVTAGSHLLLVKPQTYMNLSGKCVKAVLESYGIAPEEVLVICDDFNLPLGTIRLRRNGSSGGQKGLASIISETGTEEFPRLRIGIGPRPSGEEAMNFVLGELGEAEKAELPDILARVSDAILLSLQKGIEAAMSAVNVRAAGSNGENGQSGKNDRAQVCAPPHEAASHKAACEAKPRIMIVEDESIVAHDIKKTLQLYGYEVLSIESSGESALERFSRDLPDLVLMDIMLKGQLDGIETSSQIHTLYGVPVIFLTSYSDDRLIEQAKKTEPFGYLIKPYQDRELKTVVEMVLYKAKMERILKEKEEWLSITMNSIGDGLIATDRQGRIVLANPVAEKILGISKNRLIGEPIDRIFICRPEKGEDSGENPVLKVIRDGKAIQSEFETLLCKPDGEAIPVDFKITRNESEEKQIMGAVVVFKDISEERRIQSGLLKMQKLESVGRLAGGIAHEFNNVLTAVLGNISLVKMFTEGSGDMYECLNEAEKASLRARDLAQKLMIFSKGGSPVKETASIKELIEESAEFALKGSSATCEFELHSSLWPVEVDIDQMNQVISNVILNAAEAMGGAGVIRVKAENYQLESNNSSLAEGRYVRIEIADSGPGIPRENLHQLFDPYYSTKQPGKGMGLAICFSIVKRHGGHIDVESEIGKGTVVTIFVPASHRELNVKDDVNKAETVKISGRRVLFLDDKEVVRASARRILTRLGYDVVCVNEGSEAVDRYSSAMAENRAFDAVILDLTVSGGMGGKECIGLLRKLDPNVTAIASSGYPEDSAISDLDRLGFKGFLVKPYDVNQMGSLLFNVIHDAKISVIEGGER